MTVSIETTTEGGSSFDDVAELTVTFHHVEKQFKERTLTVPVTGDPQ